MCGRFTLTQPDKISELFPALTFDPLPPPRYNIAPSQPVAVVSQGEHHKQIRLLKWGLIPAWVKDFSLAKGFINARSETVADKPSFRTAFKRRRCLIPADGFYEWQGTKAGKQPYFIRQSRFSLFAMAGLWETWNDIETFTILTTAANPMMKPIHHRMPVILSEQNFDEWLSPMADHSRILTALMQPYQLDDFVAYPVSQKVNRPSLDDPTCIEPLSSSHQNS